MGEKEPFPVLAIRKAVGRKARDLHLLRRQQFVPQRCLFRRPFAGGAQLGACLFRPRGYADCAECGMRRPQQRPRLRDAPLTSQPTSVRELDACACPRPPQEVLTERREIEALGFAVVGEHRTRVRELDVQGRRRRDEGGALEPGENAARLRHTLRPDRGLGEEHHAAGTLDGVIARVGGIEDSHERVERVRVATRGKPTAAARDLHHGEHRVQTAARRQLLDLAGERLRMLVVAPETGAERLEDRAACAPEALSGLPRQAARIGFHRFDEIQTAELDVFRGLDREDLRQHTEPTLLAQPRLGADQEIECPRRVAYGLRRLSEESERVGIGDALDDDARQPVHDAGSLEEGIGKGEGRDVTRILLDPRELVEHCDNAGPRRWSGVGPPTAERGAEQQIQCEVVVTGVGRPLGDCAQLEYATRVAGHAVLEDLAQPFHTRAIEFGEREL